MMKATLLAVDAGEILHRELLGDPQSGGEATKDMWYVMLACVFACWGILGLLLC